MWETYRDEDATLVEVNPLIKTKDGKVLAIDAKMTVDDNASFRQPDHAALVDRATTDPLELRAKELGLNYVKLDGNVGVIGNGAGLVMSTLDVTAYAGEEFPGSPRPANFLDIGGGASAEVMANGLDVIGNAVEEGRAILSEYNHPLVTMVETMDEAARKAAELASKEA